MAPAREAHAARGRIVNAAPRGEEHLAVFLHGERVVQSGEYLAGIGKIHSGQGFGTDDVEHTDREQRGADPVSADVEQTDAELAVLFGSVAEGIASERGGRQELP